MQLEGKVALITGAGSGIGKAAALLLAKEGARIGALSRSREDLLAVVEQIRREGGEALPLVCDVSDPTQIKASINELGQHWGQLDVVFANAGTNGVWAPLEDLEPEDWDHTFAVNMKGTFMTVKYALPYFPAAGGSIIVTSSVNGTRNFSGTGTTAYSSTKAAQVAFTKLIALELARRRIRANVICPGAIETNINEKTVQRNMEGIGVPVEYPEGPHPLAGQPGSADQVAQLVLFLASDLSSHISGTEIWIDGAESLLLG